jgi:membrane protease YdiL (CAAX protease family)
MNKNHQYQNFIQQNSNTPIHKLAMEMKLSIGHYVGGFFILLFLHFFIILVLGVLGGTYHLSSNGTLESPITPWLREIGKLLLLGFGLLALHWTLRLQGRDLMSVIAPGKRLDGGMWWRAALVYGLCLSPLMLLSLLDDEAPVTMPSATTLLWLPAMLPAFALQTAAEEAFCRGYLAQGFQVLFRNTAVAALAVAVIFSLLHGWNGGERQVLYWGLSLFASYLTWRFGRLEAAMGMHFAHNILVTLFMTGGKGLPGMSEKMQPDAITTFPIPDMLMGALGLICPFLLYWLLGIRSGFIEHGWRGKPAPHAETA